MHLEDKQENGANVIKIFVSSAEHDHLLQDSSPPRLDVAVREDPDGLSAAQNEAFRLPLVGIVTVNPQLKELLKLIQNAFIYVFEEDASMDKKTSRAVTQKSDVGWTPLSCRSS